MNRRSPNLFRSKRPKHLAGVGTRGGSTVTQPQQLIRALQSERIQQLLLAGAAGPHWIEGSR
jgi:hypothetical protein